MSNDKEHIKNVLKEVLSIECPDDALTFDVENITAEDIMEEKTYHGVRIGVKGMIDGMSQPLSIDVGFGDVTVPAPQELTYPIILGDMTEFCVNAYSLETVIAEKFHTMIILSFFNSRMKDFYDVYSILSSGNYDKEVLGDAIRSTFLNRHTPYSENHLLFTDEFFLDSTKNKQWSSFLSKIKYKGSLPFVEVGRLIREILKPYWDSLDFIQ